MPRSPRWWSPRRDVELILDDEDESTASGDASDAEADGDDERTFIALSGGSWQRRLSRREKTLRGAASAGVALVVVIMLLGGPGAVLAYLTHAAQGLSPAPVAQAAGRNDDFVDVPVPADIKFNPQVTLAPANGPESFSYACWVDEDPKLLGTSAGALHLALFTVATHNWALISAPVALSAGCAFAVDQTAPDRVVLASAVEKGADGACRRPNLYLSEDRGAHWRALAWPAEALTPCEIQFQLEGEHLYATVDSPLLPASAATAGALGRVYVSEDEGVTWASADDGLAGVSDVALVAIRPGGRMLVEGEAPAAPATTGLWESDDAGAHWSQVGVAPGVGAQVFASSDPSDTAGGGWGRLYVYAASGGSVVPKLSGGAGDDGAMFLATGFAEPQWSLSALQLDSRVAPAWTVVEQPTGAEEAGALPAGLWEAHAGEGPSGSMLLAEPNLRGKELTVTPPFDLRLWNGGQWVTDQHSIPENAKLQGAAWDQGVMRVWVTFKPGISRSVQLLTFTISPADLA